MIIKSKSITLTANKQIITPYLLQYLITLKFVLQIQSIIINTDSPIALALIYWLCIEKMYIWLIQVVDWGFTQFISIQF